VLDELEVGVGCIGVIERSFADISREIGRAVVDRGWVQADKLAHYKLHAEIDRRHADEFFAVAEPRWDDSRARYNIEQGVRMGAYIFDRLYTDLLRAAV
jgi:pyrroloquinoline-quinone synthase